MEGAWPLRVVHPILILQLAGLETYVVSISLLRARYLDLMREHRHVLVVVTLLTLVMTFPTILYVFRTDVFWLPVGGDGDALTEIWDTWYGKLILSGQADRFFSDRIFYPRGVSLVYHPLNLPYIIVVNALQAIMPVSNAFSLAYMLIISISSFAAYVYLRWLIQDKWVALFGAIIFGFSPHVIGHPNHPNNALIATLPLLIYGFHRGMREDRAKWVIVAGLLTGATSVINIYAYCLRGALARAYGLRIRRVALAQQAFLATCHISPSQPSSSQAYGESIR